ncbi:MAG: OmpH family outer membrane protein [Candidatus Zipacnadales bacterium]
MSRNTVVSLVAVAVIVASLAVIVYMWKGLQPKPPESPPTAGGPGGMRGSGPGMGPSAGGMGGPPPGAEPSGSGQPRRMGGEAVEALVARIVEQGGGTEEDGKKITAFFEQRQTSTQALREEFGKLRDLLENPNATDAQIKQALAAFKTKRDAAQAELKAQREKLAADLKLANRPRLEASLLMVGVLDNGMIGAGRFGPRSMRRGAEGAMGPGSAAGRGPGAGMAPPGGGSLGPGAPQGTPSPQPSAPREGPTL